ncbi:hypothetical protein GGI09_007251 [Coemansia sp. S100]|nr:hypothetical protein GGI09_007251 [Coemansia sp. S100]
MQLCSLAKGALSALLVLAAVPAALGDSDYIETNVHYLRQFNLEPPFIDEGFQMRNFDYGGDAIINTASHIRLTPDAPSRIGWVWSTMSLPNDYWKIEFDFKIGGKGGYLYGDGMGFFVTKERASSGPVFGNRDYFNGLGVFFDTYANGKHEFSLPFIMGMLGDGKTPYDGSHDGGANRLGMCEAYFRNLREHSRASVTYLRGKFVQVQIQLQPNEKWTDCFTISNVTLPENPYLGFTALTGDISDNHDLLEVRAETLSSEALKNYNSMPNLPKDIVGKVAGTSFFGFVFKALLLSGVCGGLFVAYKKYSADSARRF